MGLTPWKMRVILIQKSLSKNVYAAASFAAADVSEAVSRANELLL
jgi:hypothetical protein